MPARGTASPLGNARRPGAVGRPPSTFELPTAEFEARALFAGLARPFQEDQIQAFRELIGYTLRHRWILYHLTQQDPPGRLMVDRMLAFRDQVLRRFDGMVAAAKAADDDVRGAD